MPQFNSFLSLDFPDGSDSTASAYNVGEPGSILGSGRSPGEGNVNPLQYSCLENPMDRGAWWATVHSYLLVLLPLHSGTLECFLNYQKVSFPFFFYVFYPFCLEHSNIALPTLYDVFKTRVNAYCYTLA